jgi:ribonuclease R
VDTKCEGLVSIHNMDEEFRQSETDYALVGQRTGRKIRIGDKVTIRVVSASLAKRQLDYDLIENDGNTEKRSRADVRPTPSYRPDRSSKPKGKGRGSSADSYGKAKARKKKK